MNHQIENVMANRAVPHSDYVDSDAAKIASAFRDAMRGVAATVTIVTTRDELGRNHGMAATAFSPVSMDPPAALVCVNSAASIHDHLTEGKIFCVNVLSVECQDIVGTFSGSAKGEERFKFGDWNSHHELTVPCLEDAKSNLLCRITSVAKVGTHSVVIGELIAVRSKGELTPLLYFNGRLGTVSQLN